jgi:hypothetical protein
VDPDALPSKSFDVINIAGKDFKNVTVYKKDLVSEGNVRVGCEIDFKLAWGAKGKVYSGVVTKMYAPHYSNEHHYTVRMDPDDFLHDHDVVLTNYESLINQAGKGGGKSNYSCIGHIHWHRVVLDECQEIKVATNKIASQVSAPLLPRVYTCRATYNEGLAITVDLSPTICMLIYNVTHVWHPYLSQSPFTVRKLAVEPSLDGIRYTPVLQNRRPSWRAQLPPSVAILPQQQQGRLLGDENRRTLFETK